jgi:hypothetical protein
MNEIVKGIFNAPLATIFIIAGILFLLVAVIGNISGKIEPGVKGRVISGIVGLAFIVLGLSMHFQQKATDKSTLPTTTPVQKSPDQNFENSVKFNGKEAEVSNAPAVSAPGTEKRELQSVAVATASTEIIEAYCSFLAVHIGGEPSSTYIVSCPAGCDEASYSLYGTDVYYGYSSICKAAIHAGLINPQGGSVGVILEKGRPAYRGSTRNKIKSDDHEAGSRSFRLVPIKQ